MFKYNDDYREKLFIGLVLEGFFFGLYSGIFGMYLQYQTSQKGIDKKQNIVFNCICVLYILSVALFVSDITHPTYQLLGKPVGSVSLISLIQMALFGCCDFLAQFILIYRCWIVWGRNIRVVIIPSILTFAFLAVWLAGAISSYVSPKYLLIPTWGYSMTMSGLALSLTVNALVTGLIVFRIFKIFRGVKATSDNQTSSATGGSKYRRIILVLIESGMALFSIQLVRIVVTTAGTDAALRAFDIINSINDMFIGITPTMILVRTAMGLSFHNEKSMEEVAIGSLSFASNHPSSVTEVGSVDQDSRDDDIGVQRSNDIDIIAR